MHHALCNKSIKPTGKPVNYDIPQNRGDSGDRIHHEVVAAASAAQGNRANPAALLTCSHGVRYSPDYK
jgi:hypothetical protein